MFSSFPTASSLVFQVWGEREEDCRDTLLDSFTIVWQQWIS